MSESIQTGAGDAPVLRVAAGEDRFGEHKRLGISNIAVKLSEQDMSGLFIAEATLQVKGGPGLHLHYDQDEWFYCAEGEFILQVGPERFRMKPGDSALGLRGVPHAWANAGEGRGRILFVFRPAGKMEAFFREAAKANVMPDDRSLFRRHGMELLGPPLSLE